MIKTGRTFNQTPEHPELQNAFNHSPANVKIQPSTPQEDAPIEENKSDESVDLSAESGSPKSAKSGGKKSDKSEEFEEFVHENEMKEENDGQDSDVTMYEPCTCERCVPPTKRSYSTRFVAWLDSKVLKRFLVYDYTPENIMAQNEV